MIIKQLIESYVNLNTWSTALVTPKLLTVIFFPSKSDITISDWNNRPFYSSLLSDLAFEWQRGWRWPCFDTDLSAFVMKMHVVSIRTPWFTQQKQWGLYQNKVTSSLAATQRPGHQAENCKMVYWAVFFAAIFPSLDWDHDALPSFS